MSTLLVGFDSAWSAHKSGAIAAVVKRPNGSCEDLGPPKVADFLLATDLILEWQRRLSPQATVIFLDQPIIVPNEGGQRPVEHILSSCVGAHRGGVQSTNSKTTGFGMDAPVWKFLDRFGGVADPLLPLTGDRVVETYPVPSLIALGWTLPGTKAQRLPKYNPAKGKKFLLEDWNHLRRLVLVEFSNRGLTEMTHWLSERTTAPKKADQDCLDACICLLAAIHLSEGRECLMVGNLATGYIVIPHSDRLSKELEARCAKTGRSPREWVRRFSASIGH